MLLKKGNTMVQDNWTKKCEFNPFVFNLGNFLDFSLRAAVFIVVRNSLKCFAAELLWFWMDPHSSQKKCITEILHNLDNSPWIFVRSIVPVFLRSLWWRLYLVSILQVGVKGEKLELHTEEGSQKVKWSPAIGAGPPLTWYKVMPPVTLNLWVILVGQILQGNFSELIGDRICFLQTYFDVPEGQNPVAVRLSTMGKGMAWVNGKSIGRYWVSYLSPLGQPSQSE